MSCSNAHGSVHRMTTWFLAFDLLVFQNAIHQRLWWPGFKKPYARPSSIARHVDHSLYFQGTHIILPCLPVRRPNCFQQGNPRSPTLRPPFSGRGHCISSELRNSYPSHLRNNLSERLALSNISSYSVIFF